MKKNKRGKEWGKGWDGKSRVPDKTYKENYDSIDWSSVKKEEKKLMKNITFEKLNLTPRVKGIFKVNNIMIEDILADKYYLYDFYRLPYLGRKSMNNIKKAFLSIGYEFKDGHKYFKKLSLDYADKERL